MPQSHYRQYVPRLEVLFGIRTFSKYASYRLRFSYPSHYRHYNIYIFFKFYLFGVLLRFQHCTGHITTGSWKGRGNQYIQFVRVLYCKLPTNGKQLPAFPLEAVPGTEPWPQRWEARVLPLCHHGPWQYNISIG